MTATDPWADFPAAADVREPFFEPPRGTEDLDEEYEMGDGGVREPFFGM